MNVHKGLCAAPFARRPLAVVLTLLAGAAYAAPQGGQIVGGNGSIHQQGQTTTIQQQTERLAINWQSFDIAADERVQFLQPSSQSIALNQVLGNNPSQILGRIDANGYVVLVNSRGILFSESATVNVGGLVASGLNLAVEDFMQGEWRFLADPDHAGFVINRGLIQASSNAVLLGRQVGNEGPQALIAADLVQLAAADAAVLTFDTDRRIGIRVEQAVLDNLQGADSAVHNSGSLRGREVLLDAAVAEDVFTRAVNNEGIIQARGIDTSGGVIRLSGRGGEVASSGTLDASAEAGAGGQVAVRGDTVIIDGEVNVAAAEGVGGTIRVSGERVALLEQARLDASGRDGGGSIHVGGGWQGQDPDIENSRISHVAAGARLDASATGNGDGGEVVVWSDGLTRFLGRIEARGGAKSGDGGRVETSGAEQLIATGRVDVGASAGAAGLYLIDPADITIGSVTTDIGGDGDPFRPGTGVAASFLSIESLLDALEQGNVTVQTANQGASGAGAGTITIEADIDLHLGDGHALTLRANQDILLLDDVQIADLTDGSASVDLVFRADRHIVFGEGSLVNSGGGSIVLDANENLGTAGNLQLAGSLFSGGGAITLRGIDLDNAGSIDAGSGDIAIFTGRGDRNSDNVLGSLSSSDSISVTGAGGNDHYRVSAPLGGGSMSVDGGSGSNRLYGSAGNDSFLLGAGSNQLSWLGIAFSNIQQVDAQGGNNSLTGTALGDAFALTAQVGDMLVRGISFSGLSEVQGGAGINSLAGFGGETFDVTGASALSVSGLAFTGLDSVAAAGGALVSVQDGGSFALTGNAGELQHRGLAFSGLSAVETVSGVVQGSAVDETYVVDGDGRLGVAAMLFSDVAEVWAGADSDDLLQGGGGNDSFQLVGSGELDHRGIRFQQIDRIDGGAGDNLVIGTADNDHFALQAGSQRFSALDIDFSNIQQVDAQGGVNSLQGTDAGDHFSLTGASGEVVARGTTFANLTQVQGGAGNNSLTGSGSDTFTVSGGNVLSRDLVFSGLGSVDAAGGTLLSNVAGESFSLTGNAGELLYQGLLFQAPGLVSTVDGVVQGSAADETYRVDGDGRLDVAGLLFDDIAEVLAGAGSDDLLQGGAGDDVFHLTGAAGELQYRNILFRQLDRVDGGDGSNTLMDSGALAFQLSATRELQVADLQFSALDRVELASGSTVLGRAQADVFTVLGDGSLRVLDVRFEGAESIVGGGTANQLVTSGSDTLSLDAGRVLLRGMDFEGIAQVQAAAGDTLLGSAGADDFVLLASGGVAYLGLEFSGLGRVQAQGAGNRVIGSDAGDTYALVDERSFDVAGTRFEAIDQVVAGAGTDTVVGRIQNDAFSVSDLNQLLVLGMIFDGIEQVDAGASSSADQLLGSAADDLFELLGERSLRYRGIVFNELNNVAAGTGDNTLMGRPVDDTVTVTGSRQLETAGLTLSGIDRVEGNAGSNLLLLPAGGADLQLGAASGSLQVADILFSAWQQVQASGDDNQLSGAPVSGDWQLLGERALAVSGVSFSGIDTVSAAGSAAQVLAASGGSDFLLRAGDAARVDGIEFSAVGGGFAGAAGDDRFALAAGFSGSLVVDAGGGSNTLEGSGADDLFLLLGSEALGYRGVSFSGIQQVEAGAGFNTVQAQVPDLSLALQGSRTAAAAGVHFEQIDRFDFGAGSNTLITASGGGEALIDGDNRVRALDLLVTGVATLQGGAGNDHFILAPGGSLIGGLFGGGGSNRLTAQGSANQWHILAGDHRVNGFAFSGLQELIDQGSAGFNLETDRGITFNSGRWIGFDAGEVARLEFQVVPQLTVAAAAIQVNVLDLPGGSLDLTAAAGVTGGGVSAANLSIEAGGDVQLSTAVDNADIVSGGSITLQQSGDIHLQRLRTAGDDIQVSGDSDIVVTRVGTGSRNTGSVTLESSLGSILVSAAGSGQINIEAGAINLEALQRIGVIDNPFFLSSATAPSISALEYVNPLLTPGTPEPIARGRRIASLTEVIASSGMRSAVQPYGVEIVAIDPAIFTALQPFTLVGDAIALPEDQRLD